MAMASSRPAQSSRKKPPIISLASANGPSRSTGLSCCTCTRTPWRSGRSDSLASSLLPRPSPKATISA
jgi:hypothetical protein